MINIKNIVLAIFGALSGTIALYFIGKKNGEKEYEAEQTKKRLQEGLSIKKDIEDIYSSSDDAVDGILREDARD